MTTVRVLGGPGTGKTTMLVAAAADRIADGLDPDSVLLLTSAKLAAGTRAALTSRMLRAAGADLPVVREPLVRSVHSYAFAVLGKAAERAGDPPPRLVTGAELDGITRELLAGDLEDGAPGWPPELRPALTTSGFAIELRDLLARCAERGVDPSELRRLGREHGRPEWVAAARFARQYEQVMLLRASVGTAAPQASVPALGAAELVGAALDALAADATLLAAERARIRLLLVDDAQHLDPQAALLVRVLAAGAESAILAGDPNQAVFGFRGANADLLLDGADGAETITLNRSHRCAPAVARAISGMAARLPGAGWRTLAGSGGEDGEDDGAVTVRMAESAHVEAAVIADALRRAHLVDGVAWSQLAVITRSASVAAALSRSLAVAGVPVEAPSAAGPIGSQPAARALLCVLAATAAGLDDERAEDLLIGPIGRVDPVSLRQLRRALRRTETGLAETLTSTGPQLPATLAAPVNRVRAVLAAAAHAHRDGRDPRYTLWQAWQRSGLQRRWLDATERGGVDGALAERNLAAVTALFDIAEAYVDRTTGASLRGLLDHVAALQLPPPAEALPSGETVAILSPHAALGRDWEMVVIAGLQDGLWPNTVPRGGVLGTQRLLDVLDGLGEDVSARAPLLAEERRLLIAAMGRARRRLLITAVDSDAGDAVALPSPFVAELAAHGTGPQTEGPESLRPQPAPPVLSQAAVVGRLRAAVCAPDGAIDDAERVCAAEQLARLATAGVPGADPSQWHGLADVSTDDPLWSAPDGEHTVALSPSTLQTLTDCPLRWLAERHGGTGTRALNSTLGSLVHALLADSSKSAARLAADLETLWATLPFDSPWYATNELERHRGMLAAYLAWHAATRHELTEVGTEIEIDGIVADPADDEPGVRVRGRIDRLERDAQGRLVVVDLKTARSPVTKDDAQRHAQLGLYQLAVAAGLLAEGEEPGGGRLVYLGKPSAAGAATEREQTALGPDDTSERQREVRAAAAATAGPHFAARVNPGCSHCPLRPSCPAHQGGPSS
ncbi:MAG: ATP-dependent DNA helicase [Mycobacterium sp.]